MHCFCCDRLLTDYEATRRHAVTKEFLDICNKCFHIVEESANIPTISREDLRDNEENYDEGLDND